MLHKARRLATAERRQRNAGAAWMSAINVWKILGECRQRLARLAGNEGVGEHVRIRFQPGPRKPQA